MEPILGQLNILDLGVVGLYFLVIFGVAIWVCTRDYQLKVPIDYNHRRMVHMAHLGSSPGEIFKSC